MTHSRPKHCIAYHGLCMAKITQNFITWLEADHIPRERFHWLSFADMCEGYWRLILT